MIQGLARAAVPHAGTLTARLCFLRAARVFRLLPFEARVDFAGDECISTLRLLTPSCPNLKSSLLAPVFFVLVDDNIQNRRNSRRLLVAGTLKYIALSDDPSLRFRELRNRWKHL